MIPRPDRIGWPARWAWTLAFLAGACGLALAYGFHEPPLPDSSTWIRRLLLAAAAGFVLSRLLLFLPPSTAGPRIRRRLVDFVVIAAAATTWLVRPSSEPFVLAVVSAYVIASALETVARAGLDGLCDGLAEGRIRPAMLTVLAGWTAAAVLGAGLLALPVSRQAYAPVEPGHPLAAYLAGMYLLDTLFTATSAVTCTGLTLGEPGTEFSRFGELVLLILVEIGGLGMLLAGSAMGWRLRHLLGWNAPDEPCDPETVRRLLRFLVITALVLQTAGGVALYADSSSSAASSGPAAGPSTSPAGACAGECWWTGPQAGRAFEAAFHAAGAFCGSGLTLSRNSFVAAGDRTLLTVVLPLMLLGSLGGPVLYDLMRRLTRRRGSGRLATDSRAILVLTLLSVAGSAVLLVVVETSRDCQLRYPRDRTPGRLMVQAGEPSSTSPPGAIVFDAAGSERAARERLASMPPRERNTRAVFQTIAARGPGFRAARLDENSLSPASHGLLAAVMLGGGGLGGTSGGGRLTMLAVLAAAFWRTANPLGARTPPARELARHWAVGTAGVALAATLGLMLVCGLLLIYREPASPAACLFEAVSASCNVGLTTGMTAALSVPSRIVLTATMLVGRVLPLLVLMRCLSWMPPGAGQPDRRVPAAVPVRDEGPIPLA